MPFHNSNAANKANAARHTKSILLISALMALPGALSAQQDAPGERDIVQPARWAVMTGTDSDIGRVKTPATRTTVTALRAMARPTLIHPGTADPQMRTHRMAPAEMTLWRVQGTLTGVQTNDDGDYHLTLRDATGNVLAGELPDPSRMRLPSRFAAQMRTARTALMHKLHPGEQPRPVQIPVQVTGLGYFGRVGKEPGSAKNGIQLHPIIKIAFY